MSFGVAYQDAGLVRQVGSWFLANLAYYVGGVILTAGGFLVVTAFYAYVLAPTPTPPDPVSKNIEIQHEPLKIQEKLPHEPAPEGDKTPPLVALGPTLPDQVIVGYAAATPVSRGMIGRPVFDQNKSEIGEIRGVLTSKDGQIIAWILSAYSRPPVEPTQVTSTVATRGLTVVGVPADQVSVDVTSREVTTTREAVRDAPPYLFDPSTASWQPVPTKKHN
jgi:hypothetical protein